MAHYWLKLHHEMLHDPKMGRLPDRLYRRTIEIFLAAGECANEGWLPSVDDLAWILRMEPADLEADLHQLSEVGIVQLRDHGWFVTNFEKRQKPASGAERTARYRERNKKQEYYCDEDSDEDGNEPVTNRYTDIELEIDTDIEIDTEREDSARETAITPPKQPKTPVPEAVKVFRENAHRYPAKSWYARVEKAVGRDPPDLAFWGDVVSNWVGLGWKPTNVKGMLECYERRELPGNDRQSKASGPTAFEDRDRWLRQHGIEG